ncbi:MAG TPA: hypothetical protein PKC19_18105, partial [Roseiflexaceae bacterium]|nr:hypothetical protein [Roseiflexaceae bacterium]
MKKLSIYTSADCPGNEHTRQIVDQVRTSYPMYPVALLDLADTIRPDFVFGTPTYVLGDQIISLGNPALQTLFELLDAEVTRAIK